jgi:hypothetical protein
MLFREITAALLDYHNKTHKVPMQENESFFLCVTAGCKVTTILKNVKYYRSDLIIYRNNGGYINLTLSFSGVFNFGSCLKIYLAGSQV